MTQTRQISDKEKSSATLKELREILAKTPDAAKIFHGEIDRRWKMIPIEQRQWVCKLAGCESVADVPYTKIDIKERAKIRSFLTRLRRLVDMFGFALNQW